MIRRLLIANRGEIAVRLIRACRELGISPVAVYSDADAAGLHVRLADVAVRLGPGAAAESYLCIDKLIAAARLAHADAVHPGYGFLSENADFGAAVQAAGLVWVGPSPDAIRQMGSKTRARDLMQRAGVPIVPGYPAGAGGSFAEAASAIGYPVLVKASGGGGGRGMRIVRQAAELDQAISSAQAEAATAFGDSAVFLEKYLEHGRHIEIQVFGDAHGHVVHLLERECSVQRRHQKIIEESPSPLLAAHPELRAAMGQAAVAAAASVGYQNAGTVEFIVDPDTLAFYFLEMNTRLQVEHPVTELVTGLDLVKLQLRVAAGEPLPFTQAQVQGRGPALGRGHAMECRLYAEDPAQSYLPSIGKILLVVEPRGPGVRVDSGFETGDAVSQYYDALLAKVIVAGADRSEALARMDAALAQTVVLGLATNVAFLRAILAHPEFRAGNASTQFIARYFSEWQAPGGPLPDEALIAAALADALAGRGSTTGATTLPETAPADPFSPWRQADGFRLGGALSVEYSYDYGGRRYIVLVDATDDGFTVTVNGRPYLVKASQARGGELELELEGLRRCLAYVAADGANRWVALAGSAAAETSGPYLLTVPEMRHTTRGGLAAGQAALEARMPGTVRQVLVAEGDSVTRGQTLALLEAMKMEIRITAPEAGRVTRVAISAGQTVERGQALFALGPARDQPAPG